MSCTDKANTPLPGVSERMFANSMASTKGDPRMHRSTNLRGLNSGGRRAALLAAIAAVLLPRPIHAAPPDDADTGPDTQTQPASEPVGALSTSTSADLAATDDLATSHSGAWWQSFGDARLNRLVEQALASNLDVEVAVARIEESKAIVVQRRAALLPSLRWDSTVTSAPLKSLGFQFGGGAMLPPDAPTLYYIFSSQLVATYEIDLVGKNYVNTRAAKRDAAALKADADRVRNDLVGRVVSSYYDLVAAREQLALAQAQVASNQQRVDLSLARANAGQGSLLDVRQQEQALAASKALVPQAELQAKLAENQLAVLIAQPPGETIASADKLPTLSPTKASVDAETLKQARPDLRAAELRARAAEDRRKFGQRSFVPTLRLTSNGGYQAIDTLAFRDQWYWNAGATLSVPISTGGQTFGQLKQNTASARTARRQSDALSLTAQREVRDAQDREAKQREQYEASAGALEAAKKALEESELRYLAGQIDYLPVLSALVSVQSNELSLVSVRRGVIGARISLHTALGDTWARDGKS